MISFVLCKDKGIGYEIPSSLWAIGACLLILNQWIQACSQDFLWAGAYLKNRDPIFKCLNDTLCKFRKYTGQRDEPTE